MKNFDVLNKDTDIFGNHFLEASAGTGKTFAIEHLFVRFILEDLMTVEQILVVTFTKAAARELKYRIRNNIEKALSYLKREGDSFFGYLMVEEKDKNEKIKRLQSALQLFENSQIFTIHGFCYSMLAKYAFEAKIAFDLSEEKDYIDLFQRECLDFLRLINKKNFFSEQISIILKKYPDMTLLIDKIVNYLPKKERYFSSASFLKQFNDLLTKFSNEMALFSSEDSDNFFEKSILEDFQREKKYYKKLKNIDEEELILQLNLFIKILKENNCSEEIFDQMLKTHFSLLLFFEDSNLKKKIIRPDSDKLNYPTFFSNLSSLFLPLIQIVIDEERILNNLAFEIHEKAKIKFAEEDLYTFDDILINMNQALDLEEFQDRVKNKFKAVVIDEFQDTDPIQWSIFKKLFFKENEERMRAFYLVGDPKQSIYSFRNADLATYFSAEKFLGKDAKSFLNTNYRSSPRLIKSLNFLFSREFIPDWMDIPEEKSKITYQLVNSGLQDDTLFLDESPIVFFVARDTTKGKRWPSDNLEKSTIFPYIFKEIIRLNNEKKIALEKIAILVKDRYQAQSIKRYLLSHGIPAHSLHNQPLANTLAFQSMEEILSAVINFHDLNKIKIALAGPYIRWVDEDIKQKKMDECLLQFYKLNEILKSCGLSLFFRAFLDSSWFLDGESVYAKIINKTDLSLYQNTMQLIELFLDKEREEKLTDEAILNLFIRLRELDPASDNRLVINPSNDLNSVEIMTTHMSKGLEFDVVFALGSASRQPPQEEENQEKFRQLYVALTRAKKKLYIPFILDENGYNPLRFSSLELFFNHVIQDKKKLDNDAIVKKLKFLHEREIITCDFVDMPAEEIFSLAKKDNIDLKFDPKILSHYIYGKIYSFSNLAAKPKDILPLEEREKKTEILFSAKDFPPGPEIGILIHEMMEKIFKKEEKYDSDCLRKIISDSLSFTMYAGKEDLFYKIILQALETPLTNDGFSLKEVPKNNIFTETEFMFSFLDGHNFMKGFVDLIFFYQDKYYLIDWKTNWLGDEYSNYSKARLEKAMEEHKYFLQASIYSEALKRYLKAIERAPFEKIFGGFIYLFLRGIDNKKKSETGVYHFKPDLSIFSRSDFFIN
jgi:exodeoxyribonuclease V beta subunit